uniref:Secreted protein n=1 Tax=Pristhesancus plagipennis TaxID=1955184 RepID=A0A2K8JLW8_PRIPG|nr:secreted hypothetical protein [Pristhesancus plagipennis]
MYALILLLNASSLVPLATTLNFSATCNYVQFMDPRKKGRFHSLGYFYRMERRKIVDCKVWKKLLKEV